MSVCTHACSHREAVVPAPVCHLLARHLASMVLPEVPVQVVSVHVGLSSGEAHAAEAALVPRVQLRHHRLVAPGGTGSHQPVT